MIARADFDSEKSKRDDDGGCCRYPCFCFQGRGLSVPDRQNVSRRQSGGCGHLEQRFGDPTEDRRRKVYSLTTLQSMMNTKLSKQTF